MDKIIKELEEKKEKTDNLLELWYDYKGSKRILYIPPTPDIIDETIFKLETWGIPAAFEPNECKLSLEYFKKAQEYYNNYDFIVNEENYYNNFNDPEDIEKYHISAEKRNKLQELCTLLEDKLHELTDDNV